MEPVLSTDQQTPECSLVEGLILDDQLSVPEEWIQELEEVYEQELIQRPSRSRLRLQNIKFETKKQIFKNTMD